MAKVNDGFTLVEVLLYLAILGIVVSVLMAFLYAMLAAKERNHTVMEVEYQGAQVMQLVSQTIRDADAVTTPTPGNSTANLVLDMSVVADDPTEFELSGNQLIVTEGVFGLPIDLTSTQVIVTNLQFTNLARAGTPDVIKVEFTVSFVNPDGRHEYDYTRNFYSSSSTNNF